MSAKKYTLKEGVVLKPFGANTTITNENLTDEIAEYLLESGKATKEQFELIKTKTK